MNVMRHQFLQCVAFPAFPADYCRFPTGTIDHNTFLGNCPPTPPLSQHFVLSEK